MTPKPCGPDGQNSQLRSGQGTDRYGRLVAYTTLAGAGRTLQEALLAQGETMVSARIGEKACAEALFAAEKAARAAKRGLWADPNSALLSSENLAGLDAARGRFALVQGRVLSVRESGATIYVISGGAGRATSPSASKTPAVHICRRRPRCKTS